MVLAAGKKTELEGQHGGREASWRDGVVRTGVEGT